MIVLGLVLIFDLTCLCFHFQLVLTFTKFLHHLFALFSFFLKRIKFDFYFDFI